MKFVCLECDRVMDFSERQLPGDGTLAAVFECRGCKREMAMLANEMETRFVSSMGVKIGGREVPEQPMELTRSGLAGGRDDAFAEEQGPGGARGAGGSGSSGSPNLAGDIPVGDSSAPAVGSAEARGAADPGDVAAATPPPRIVWTEASMARLEKVPTFVRGMVKRIYTDYARERGIHEITPEVMSTARVDLGLEGM